MHNIAYTYHVTFAYNRKWYFERYILNLTCIFRVKVILQYIGMPALYFCGVATMAELEYNNQNYDCSDQSHHTAGVTTAARSEHEVQRSSL